MIILAYLAVLFIVLLHAAPAVYIYGHCKRSSHSLTAWLKFLSEAPEIREEMHRELPVVRRYCQLYMLWLCLKITKVISGVDPEKYQGVVHGC